MKYIQTYERILFPTMYKVGDYVLILKNSISIEKYMITALHDYLYKDLRGTRRTGTKILSYMDDIGNRVLGGQVYDVEDSNGKTTNAVSSNDSKYDSWYGMPKIIRKLTPEEIEQYEIEKTSNKYNL